MKKNVLLVGDFMQDIHTYGTCDRISPEAPVPVVKSFKSKTSLGGAGNLLRNLIPVLKLNPELRLNVLCPTWMWEDEDTLKISEGLSNLHIYPNLEIPKIVKNRIFANDQQVLRLDEDPLISDFEYLNIQYEQFFERNDIGYHDCILISDYDKGSIFPKMLPLLTEKTSRIYMDPGLSMKNIIPNAILKMNDKEFRKFKETLHWKSENCSDVIVTEGSKGVSHIRYNSLKEYFSFTKPCQVVDTCGAGDSFLACLFYFHFVKGQSISYSIRQSNNICYQIVQFKGVSPITIDMLVADNIDYSVDSPIKSHESYLL